MKEKTRKQFKEIDSAETNPDLLFFDEVWDHVRAINGSELDEDRKEECAKFISLALIAVRAVNKAKRAIVVG